MSKVDDPVAGRPWSAAMAAALYGTAGFYRGGADAGPAAHFRTSVHASPAFAVAVLALLDRVDGVLGHPDHLDVVDVGAGRGELLRDLHGLLAERPELLARTTLYAVELAERPAHLPAQIRWTAEIPRASVGLLVANEWLDTVPVDVAERAAEGTHEVLVTPDGEEVLGGPATASAAAWLARWWPLDDAQEGDRAEIGSSRDAAWADAVGSLDRGFALAIDYGHLRAGRQAGEHATGTLVGYRSGRLVPPLPDGSCDITAHVAIDACAEAGLRAGATATVLRRQRDALGTLGVTAAPELVDSGGLGAFWWLLQSVGRTASPGPLRLI